MTLASHEGKFYLPSQVQPRKFKDENSLNSQARKELQSMGRMTRFLISLFQSGGAGDKEKKIKGDSAWTCW